VHVPLGGQASVGGQALVVKVAGFMKGKASATSGRQGLTQRVK